jgi:hypothetical protein
MMSVARQPGIDGYGGRERGIQTAEELDISGIHTQFASSTYNVDVISKTGCQFAASNIGHRLL